MLNTLPVTIAGNVTADPELRKAGEADVVNFTVAYTPRVKDPENEGEYMDGDTLFIRVAAWRREAVNVSKSLSKGDRVLIHGNLKARYYESKKYIEISEAGKPVRPAPGEFNYAQMLTVEMDAQEVGLSTAFATVEATRVKNGNGNSDGGSKPSKAAKAAPPEDDEEF